MTKLSKVLYFLISVVFFILFDGYFSDVILKNLQDIPQNPVLDLIFVQNYGAAFSILQDSKIFLIGFSAFAVLAIVGYVIKHAKNISGISLFWTALLVAGIFCNMYERIVFGYVRDFFKLNFVNFPVFNISDIFINVGVFAIVVIIISHEISNRRINRSKKN